MPSSQAISLSKEKTKYGPSHCRSVHGDYRTDLDLESSSKNLYQHQSSLPILPVPRLQETLALYLESIIPLCESEEEYNEAKRITLDFMQSDTSKILQERLEEHARQSKNTSYIATWWNTFAYLRVRDPVVFNVSYFFHFADSIHAAERTQVGRAAALLRASMIYRRNIISGDASTDFVGRGPHRKPLCSTGFKYIFNSCRIPHKQQDYYRIYDPNEYNHVVVIFRGQFFTFSLVHGKQAQWDDDSYDKILTFAEIYTQLECIVGGSYGEESSIGILSSEDRDTWAEKRNLLIQNGNEESLRIIESSVLILTLDEEIPCSRQDVARALWHGNGKNRFFDKCVQLTVFKNAKAGLLGEHSLLDGMPMLVYADFLVSGLHFKKIEFSPKSKTCRVNSVPVKIQFRFDTAILSAILHAERVFMNRVHNHVMNVTNFYGFGKRRIIADFSCSPDAFVQVSIQLAYRRLFGTNVATYEATQTRAFLHGRTEVTRSCSQQSSAFACAMIENAERTSTSEKRLLLMKAIKYHSDYMRRAAQGRGVDRHLFSLQLVRDQGCDVNLPFFDANPLFLRAKYWKVSTSHLANELIDGFGWGQVVPDGFGIAYGVKQDFMQFNIACRRDLGQSIPGFDPLECDWAQRMGDMIHRSLYDMANLFPNADNKVLAAKI